MSRAVVWAFVKLSSPPVEDGLSAGVCFAAFAGFDIRFRQSGSGQRTMAKKASKKAATKNANAKTDAVKPVEKKHIDSYSHADQKRTNNPPVGLVTPDTEPLETAKKTYEYDPHLNPQLMWAGKAERTSFDVPTVSLHVHERIDPKSIIAAVRTNGDRAKPNAPRRQLSLFEEPAEYLPLRDALDFYKHPHGWTNRLVAGDSLLVMNSLLEKEGMAGKVQMIYIDPPYGIRYGSNFQPFVNRRDVKDGKDEDLTQEPETLKAFRDTWELGIHSYLTYLRDRLLLSRDLLHDSGSVFVQISDENLHHVMEVMHEVFGGNNFLSVISIRKTTSQGTATYLGATTDFVIWFAKDRSKVKYRQLYVPRSSDADDRYDQALTEDGEIFSGANTGNVLGNSGLRLFQLDNLTSSRPSGEGDVTAFEFEGQTYAPGKGTFKTHAEGLSRLGWAGRLQATGSGRGGTLRYRRFKDDFPISAIGNLWYDISGSVQSRSDPKVYVVQSSTSILQRCMLMTTDAGDIVLDPTCGSGTTAFVAEQWGRRWITCDTSRVAVTLAKQRLMTAGFDYYTPANPKQGVSSGFRYGTVPHVTLKSIANNPEIKEGMTREQIDAAIKKYADQETLYDQPEIDRSKARVTGPFTMEAVPAINVRPMDEAEPGEPVEADNSIARSGPTLRQAEWRDELARTGVRGKGGSKMDFIRLETLPATRWLHATGETREDRPKTVVVSFGPEHAPLEQRQVEQAWEEARSLQPKPDILLFAAFHFDPEAAKDIDELDPKKTGIQFLKLQMNTDLLTDDLKKKRASNESFWLIGQPDVSLRKIHKGPDAGLWEVEVHGFDYYNPTNGNIESGDTSRIATWLLDTDYDGRSLLPRQVFFPMSGAKDGWSRLAKNLKAEIDEELVEAYRGTVSLPFALGSFKRVAAKIIDDRGIESLKILRVE